MGGISSLQASINKERLNDLWSKLYTDFKVKLDKSSLTKETFINLYIGNIKNLSTILGILDNQLSDKEIRYKVLKTIEMIIKDQEDILHRAIKGQMIFHKPA